VRQALDAWEAPLFRALNRVAVPLVRRGLGSPCLAPLGLVVLEHTGRHSGALYEAPLMGFKTPAGTLVSTYRGERSQWLRNLEREPSTHYWVGGRRRACQVRVARGAGVGVALLTPA